MALNRKDIRTAANGVSMQHRHFAFIAATLAATKPDVAGPATDQWEYVARTFASDCRATNPKFDLARFLAACGIEQ
jgi:hypothetical protein